MKKQIILMGLIAFIFIFTNLVSASLYLNIYLDEKGNAEFLGETNENPLLPEGISVNNGNIIGSTDQLTNKNAEIWRFSYTLNKANINIILPKGAVIKNITKGEVYIDNNQIAVYSQSSIDFFVGICFISYIYVLHRKRFCPVGFDFLVK